MTAARERNEPRVGGAKSARLEVERTQVRVEVHVQPLASRSARTVNRRRHEGCADAAVAMVRPHHGIEDEGVHAPVPCRVHESHEVRPSRAHT